MRALLLLALLAGAARAEVHVSVLQTDPPGEAVTLGRDEAFYVRIAYSADEPVRIWARPYLNGREVVASGTRSNASVPHTGTGEALGWFSFQHPLQADEVRIHVGRGGSPQAVELSRHKVALSATGQPGAARARAPWVDELTRENEAKARQERERLAEAPASKQDAALTSGLMLLVAAVVLAVPGLLVFLAWKAARGELAVSRGDYIPYAASALAGLGVCLAISLATGRKEAWDSGLYVSLGIPIMVLGILAISYLYPRRTWRWTLSMALGQSAAMLLGGNSLSLWPLALIAMLFFSLPQFAAGLAGSWLARR